MDDIPQLTYKSSIRKIGLYVEDALLSNISEDTSKELNEFVSILTDMELRNDDLNSISREEYLSFLDKFINLLNLNSSSSEKENVINKISDKFNKEIIKLNHDYQNKINELNKIISEQKNLNENTISLNEKTKKLDLAVQFNNLKIKHNKEIDIYSNKINSLEEENTLLKKRLTNCSDSFKGKYLIVIAMIVIVLSYLLIILYNRKR